MSMTLRDAMRLGQRGNFARSLLALVEEPTLRHLVDALGRADEGNQAAIERALPGALAIVRTIYNEWPSNWAVGLEEQFKALVYLDEETANPHLLELRTGEPKNAYHDGAALGAEADAEARDRDLLDAPTYRERPEAALAEKGVG